GRLVLDDVAGEDDVGVRHPGNDVAGGMGAPDEPELDTALAEIERHALLEGDGRPGEAGDGLGGAEEAREPAVFGIPVLLAELGEGNLLLGHIAGRGEVLAHAAHSYGFQVPGVRFPGIGAGRPRNLTPGT